VAGAVTAAAFCLWGTSAYADGRGWRGDGSGQAPNAQPPTSWDIDERENIFWQTEVGKSQSTPVIVAGRIFLTAEPDALVCVDRQEGKVLWSKNHGPDTLPPEIKLPEKKPRTVDGCGYATPTPVSDGKLVYVVFGTGIVACYDLDGNRQWIRYLDLPQITEFGRSASPVLAAGKLLVSLSGLTALDPRTGAILWDAPEAKSSYGTPAVAKIGDVDVAIAPNGDYVRVADGKILAAELAATVYTSPLVVGNMVYFVDVPTAAFRLPETAGETAVLEKLWENDDVEGEFVASPICHEGILYCVSNEGMYYAIDTKTGETLLEHEPEIGSASGRPGLEPANLYPSLTFAGGYLFMANDGGETLVLEPGTRYKEIAHNYLDKGSGASPTPDGDFLLLRGGRDLYCIGSHDR
jgi:outer membrane protein assembly factor BamB